ncbi:5-oxoprolinase subunit PxpA [Winogradskyella sp. A3E31]|uniref:5-oxoprolinase subunit PxpA n=1 Tax=Winogradskyella sp. A3E31 TaxID=3349637 RepID=UPI00398ADFD6
MKKSIDINADVGEGVGNEAQLMPYLASCNIACGGHAGDEETMHKVVDLAIENSVKIGAHPSFPDKENFGRQIINISAADLYTSLKAQIRALLSVIRKKEISLHHIKPHGALYNLAAKDHKTATVIIEVMKSIALPLKLYAPYNSVIASLAEQENIPVVYEAFGDRNYNTDLSLVSRQQPKALITDKHDVFEHLYHMFIHDKVKTIDGVEVPIKVSTFCIHSDTENAVEIAEFLHQKFKEKYIIIR